MLTDLATVKAWLGITGTTDDARLTTLIAGVDEQVKRYCARNFERGTVLFKTRCDRDNPIVLDETPVEAILYSAMGSQAAITVNHATAQHSVFIVSGRTGTPTIRVVANGVATDIAIAIGDTLADVAAGFVAAGWTADVADGFDAYPAVALHDQETGDAEATTDQVLYGALVPVSLRREQEAGIYRLTGAPSGIYSCFTSASHAWLHENEQRWRNEDRDNIPLVVVYTGGYQAAAIPAGLTLLVIKMCCDAWRGMGANAALKSEKVGDYAYTKFDQAQVASAIGPYMTALDQYRRV